MRKSILSLILLFAVSTAQAGINQALTSTAAADVAFTGKAANDTVCTLQLYGSQTGLQFTVQGSLDGTNGWTALTVIEPGPNVAYTATTISPNDSTSHIYQIPNVQGITGFRVHVIAQTGGTANWQAYSTANIGNISLVTGNLSSNSSGAVAWRNAIYGGDFTTNPFQRGTSQAADIASTLTYGPDRFWFKGGASSTINFSSVADTSTAGFGTALKWQRKSGNTDVSAFNMGHVLETTNSIRFQGLPVTLSFYAKTGALYSGGSMTVQLEAGTGTDDTAANLLAGSWTTQAHVINTTQALTTTMTRYTFTGTVPATATQLGLLFQWTPVGTAGATDFIQVNGFQLEVGSTASVYEHREAATELALCQRYFVRFTENNGGVFGTGMISATNAQTIMIPLPVQMRVAPTVTVTAGGFLFQIAGTATAVGGGFAGGSVQTVNTINVVGTVTATVGQGSLLIGGNTTGRVNASAEY